jgi:phosphatidate cytidylyltransferase
LCRLAGAASVAYAVAVALAFAFVFAFGFDTAAFAVSAAFWVLVAPPWLARGLRDVDGPGLVAAGFVVLVPAAAAMVWLDPRRLLAVLVLVWIADSAAYFVGRAWGRRKLAPSISPGKTWEGAAGGVAAALVYAIICKRLFADVGWAAYAAAAVLLAVLSIVGDLFESAAKRRAGVKDSGALLPGHGGILDRIDSATAVLPLSAFLLSLLPS